MEACTETQCANRRTVALTFALIAAWLACSTLLTIRSYWRSDSLTLTDVTVRAEEGLIWLRVPLVRLARTEEATTQWTTYKRRNDAPVWETETTEIITLRLMVENIEATVETDAGLLWGFGYLTASNMSNARPGRCITVIAPIWAVSAMLTIVVGVFIRRRIRFGLRSILVGTALVGGLLWLLALRAG